MKRTKIMIAFITVTILSWFLFGLLVYLVSDMSLKNALVSAPSIIGMVLIGWIPGIIVSFDISEDNE